MTALYVRLFPNFIVRLLKSSNDRVEKLKEIRKGLSFS
jgi:hypothetical protein